MWFRNIFRGDGQTDTGSDGDNGEQSSPVTLPPQALHQLDRLQLSASRFLRGAGFGLRSSLRRRPAAEFCEHRVYVPGDDTRHVDWRASARHEHIFIKQGEYPKDATVYLLLDCSASMSWGDPPKMHTELALAAALGYLTLTHGDRLVVVPLTGQKAQPLGPISGKGQVPTLLNYLRGLEFEGAVPWETAIRDFRGSVARGGLTLLLSDLLDVPDLDAVLDYLPAPSWDVLVLHLLHAEELDPELRGNVRMVDIETEDAVNYDVDAKALKTYRQRLEVWREALELACVENNAFYTTLCTSASLEREILPQLRSLNVVVPL